MTFPRREEFRMEALKLLMETRQSPMKMLIDEVRQAELFLYGGEDETNRCEPGAKSASR